MAQLSQDLYNIGQRNTKYTFAEYPSIKIYKESTGRSWNNHLLFGDYIKILDTEIVNDRVYIRSRNNNGWVKVSQIQKERILEVNFVDIGQGDGCHVVTPDDKHILIDAGESDNMNRYLTWRFNLYNRRSPLKFPFTIVISHSDKDHYFGFKYIFNNNKLQVDTIYHNGLLERPGDSNLGETFNGYITGLVTTTEQVKVLIEDENNRKGKNSLYCKTLYDVLKYSPNVVFKSLSMNDQYVKGYDQQNVVNGKQQKIEVLGPVTETINGKEALKSINNLGKDKNGHSVILKLVYDKLRVLLGGDVNTEFGEIIHNFYQNNNELNKLLVDVAKACHHGSNHFHYDFIKDINACATVISSGDDESYAHPRPDTIGALGKCGYGDKPLIFSTELARSNKEITFKKLDKVSEAFAKIKVLEESIRQENDPVEKKKLISKKKDVNKEINSFITKYGMINLRSDGRRAIIAQKLESPAPYGKWDIHKMEYNENSGRFEQK